MNHSNLWLLDDLEEQLNAPPPPAPKKRASLSHLVNEMTQVILLAFAMYIGLNVIIPRYEVEGSSMEPSFHTAQRVIVSRLHYLFTDPHRGDIVVFKHGDNLIKRIIGLPGETITLRQGRVYIDGTYLQEDYIEDYCGIGTCRDTTWELGPDEYFVLGDNRPNSNDSHNFGPIHRDQIIGKVILRYWPMNALHEFLY